MSKEYLEALNYLNQFINEMTRCLENPKEYAKGYDKEIFYKYKYTFETTIKQALQRLEAIENTNTSEALNITKATEKYTGIDLSIIKQALLKAQSLEKVLEIIKKKRVDIDLLNMSSNAEEYNFKVSLDKELTQEDFEWLKRYFK